MNSDIGRHEQGRIIHSRNHCIQSPCSMNPNFEELISRLRKNQSECIRGMNEKRTLIQKSSYVDVTDKMVQAIRVYLKLRKETVMTI